MKILHTADWHMEIRKDLPLTELILGHRTH